MSAQEWTEHIFALISGTVSWYTENLEKRPTARVNWDIKGTFIKLHKGFDLLLFTELHNYFHIKLHSNYIVLLDQPILSPWKSL